MASTARAAQTEKKGAEPAPSPPMGARGAHSVDQVEKIPFFIRLKAWWEGRDPLAVWQEYRAAFEELADSGDDRPKKKKIVIPTSFAPEKGWPESRVSFCEKAWGEGFTEPGGPDLVLELTKPLGLSPANSSMMLGVGLGGWLRAVSKEYNNWTIGLESDEEAARIAGELNVKAGMKSRSPIEHCDYEALELPAKKYDAIFAKEMFHRVQAKDEMFKALASSMKDQGQILFTDFVVESPAADSKPLRRWREAQPAPVHLTSLELMRDALETLGFDVRVVDDHTELHKANLLEGWAKLTERLPQLGLTQAELLHLVTEGESVARCITALDSGDLQVVRVHAIFRRIRLLSE